MATVRLPRLLRRHQVEDLVGLNRAQIYEMQRTGQFPHNVKIGTRAVAWFEEDVLRWLAERRHGRP
jgi:prophage regulatory protein